MAKLVKLFLIFGPVHGSIKVIKKYANPGQTIDESLMSTLCLPRIELVDEPTLIRTRPRFQTFLVTKEDGQVLYGSGLIVYDRHNEPPPFPGAGRYASFCYTIITDTPFIHATRLLLHLVWEKKCDDMIIRAMMNIPLPARRKCIRIVTPLTSTTETTTSNLSLVKDDIKEGNSEFTKRPKKSLNAQLSRTIDDIYLYRGMTDLPILDYPLRELFSFLHIDEFLLAYACILMEFRTLIISQDNYKLMMVGETLTSLLLPLKWCNVYVPILPPVYGATYLDAPTSYIMGINTQVTELPENLNHIQCRIYCDDSRVVCDANSLNLPLFLNDIKKEIITTMANSPAFQEKAKPTTYLDDLKFNRAIRMLFIKTIRKNILANYERYIVDVPEQSSGVRQFDVVSYLSDQPEFMRSFLSKFLDTQLFASFVDENAKRFQQSWLSIFDMEPEELSEQFSDDSLDRAFQSAQRIHLMDLRQEHPDIEVKTVPASPMRLRRRMPGLSAITSRLNFANKLSKSTSIEYHNQLGSNMPFNQSSPPIHRNSVATVSLQGHLSLNSNSTPPTRNNQAEYNNSSPSLKPNLIPSPQVVNGKIVELINEVKDLTKRILIEKMGDQVPDHPDALLSIESKGVKFSGNSPLIGALCDLIERVWAHGAIQDSSSCCPLWRHLLAFTRLRFSRSSSIKQDAVSNSYSDLLSPRLGEPTELDKIMIGDNRAQHANLFGSKLNHWFRSNIKLDSLTRDLVDDFRTILMLDDVKTDIGKARAFIKLSLERKKLSKHLKTLIGDQVLLNSLYKPYAFLRCEDEREQFLMYLLTLNAVDLPCYTSTFVSVINTRRMNTNKATI